MLKPNKMHNWQTVLTLAATLLVSASISATAQASPNVWWNHYQPEGISQADCVNKATDTLMTEKAGRITKEEDGVRAWSETTLSVVECLKTGDKLTVMVLVTSHDAKAGNRIYNILDEKMKTLRQ